MSAGGVGALKFNSNMIQIPPELDLMDAVNWDGGRSEVEQEDAATAESDSSTTSMSLFDIHSSPSNITTIDDNEYYTTTAETTQFIDNDNIDQQEQPSPSPTTTLPTNNLFQQHRKLQSFGTHTGPTPILVVKVTDKNGLAPDELTAEISDDVFGTTADTVNLKSQLHACSMGRLVVIPGDNNSGKINQSVYNAPGVMAVKLSISIETKTNAEIRNAITAEVEKELGIDLPGPYKHVMYVLKKCYNNCGWAAYAFVNGWNSVYVGDYYKYVGVQVHELGHNFGLGHSGGLDGGEYSDHTCMQGNPLYSDHVGDMCYNGAKSWQIGWYNDRKIMLNPKTELASNANWGTLVTLVGIADYQNVPSIPVVLKLETGTDDDYFIAFNRAVGVNADNVEADDEVTVVLAGKNGESVSSSDLKATLQVGERYVISKFGGGGRDCPIKLVSIDKSTSVWKANVQVGSEIIPTPKPTYSPTTRSPTNRPVTASPTTKAPTSKPSTKSPTLKPTKPTKTKRRTLSAPAPSL